MINEAQLVELVNDYLSEVDVYLENYQIINLYVYDEDIIKAIIKECKFKDIGNVYDYPEVLTQPQQMNMMQLTHNFDMIERIAVSKKFQAIMNYSVDVYCVRCTVIIDTDKLKKFSKVVKRLLDDDTGINIFRDTTFKTGKGEYLEIDKPSDSKESTIDVIPKKIVDEHLVFDPDSVINEVMKDITVFFKDSTVELYKKLEIPYKRGVILYGEPGNGKSAMIRELIRNTPDVAKIMINAGVPSVAYVLSSLVKALNGKKAMIVIEDMDSVITPANRSEFLNVLDGVDVISGVFFVGTTNYPERIDPALMNRAGRFDRTYKIDNPTEVMRRKFFESKKLGKILEYYKVYKDDSKKDTDEGIVELFTQHSEGLPMANLKELITSTTYMLASNPDMSIEEAIEKNQMNIINTRAGHIQSYNNNLQMQQMGKPMLYPATKAMVDDEYDEEEDD